MFIRDLVRGMWRRQPVEVQSVATPREAGRWPLHQPLVELGPGDVLTLQDCVSGLHIFGASGSGKTSGSLALLAQAMLREQWGMLVLTTKPGEAEQWTGWAERCGRGGDVRRIHPGGADHFNFLDYLERHPDPGASIAMNIGDLLTTIAQHAKPKAKGSETSAFFAESASRLATEAIQLLRAAGERLTLQRIGQVINAAPTHPLAMQEEGFAESLVPTLLRAAEARQDPQSSALCDYWLREIPGMNERTRGDVVATLGGAIFRFTQPPFDNLIASPKGSSFIPEVVDTGRILILDCPVITYQQVGRMFQIAMKHLVQQAVLRRPRADTTRPVAIIADEAQNFVTFADHQYQAVCRDFRGVTVYATQTIDNYREAVGSDAAVEALLASLVTKVFHANSGRTNEWAEKLIAGDWRVMDSQNMNHRQEQGHPSFGSSRSESIQPQVLASEFTRLRNGGERNGGCIDAVVFQPGRIFRQTGKPFLRVTFSQALSAAQRSRP